MKILIQLILSLLLASCAFSKTHTEENTNKAPFLNDLGNGIYVHHGKHLDIDTGYQGDICNLSVIIGSKGVAVIDTGGSLKIGNQLRNAIKQITPLPILYVINTHVHPDHIFGNAAFVQDKPIFVGHSKLSTAMQLRKETYEKLNRKYLGADANGAVTITPTETVKDMLIPGLTLDLGDRTLDLIAYQTAHTNTDISVMDNKSHTFFAGDLLFTERTPVVEGDIKGLIAALDEIKTFSISTIVPGHGHETANWISAVTDEQRYLKALLADIRADIKAGVSMEKAMDTAAAGEREKWVLFNVANRRNVNTIYPQLEWE